MLRVLGSSHLGVADRPAESGAEVERLEEHVGGAVAVGGLEGVAEVAAGGERQALVREGRATDIATQALELLELAAADADAGVQGEAAHLREEPARATRRRAAGSAG
jgi:hypothetical protein